MRRQASERRPAGRALARGALVDVAAEHALESLGQEAALDDEAALAVQVAAGAQLGQQEELHVLQLPVHGLAQLHEVGEHRLLGALARHLRPRTVGVLGA